LTSFAEKDVICRDFFKKLVPWVVFDGRLFRFPVLTGAPILDAQYRRKGSRRHFGSMTFFDASWEETEMSKIFLVGKGGPGIDEGHTD
jgi:hypothetical protein